MFKLFVLGQLHRLEVGADHCVEYTGSWREKVMLIFSFMGLFLYVFFGFTAVFTSRTCFHQLLWSGLFLTQVCVSVVNEVIPKDHLVPAVCSLDGVTINEEASVIGFVMVFFFFFHMNQMSRSWVYVGSVSVFMVVIGFAGMLSLLLLQMALPEEVAVGGTIGALLGSVMSMVSLCFLEPLYSEGSLDGVVHAMHLSKESYF